MPTIEELIEESTRAAEDCVRDSKLVDYAWMKDQVEVTHGRAPHFLHDLIDRQYAELLGGIDGSSDSNPRTDP